MPPARVYTASLHLYIFVGEATGCPTDTRINHETISVSRVLAALFLLRVMSCKVLRREVIVPRHTVRHGTTLFSERSELLNFLGPLKVWA